MYAIKKSYYSDNIFALTSTVEEARVMAMMISDMSKKGYGDLDDDERKDINSMILEIPLISIRDYVLRACEAKSEPDMVLLAKDGEIHGV